MFVGAWESASNDRRFRRGPYPYTPGFRGPVRSYGVAYRGDRHERRPGPKGISSEILVESTTNPGFRRTCGTILATVLRGVFARPAALRRDSELGVGKSALRVNTQSILSEPMTTKLEQFTLLHRLSSLPGMSCLAFRSDRA